MHKEKLEGILRDVAGGKKSVHDALVLLKSLPFENLGFANVDTHRHLRCGCPEVIFCQRKTPKQVSKIAEIILRNGSNLLATRADKLHFSAIKKINKKAEYNEQARAVTVRIKDEPLKKGVIMVVTAGTSDIPVAEEARVTAEMMNCPVKTLYDVGVAGIHRLLSHSREIQAARAVIVVAGMEGALASVVGGLVDKPVVAVPTSVGYGASFNGIAPLLTMLNSCTPNVAVVNIDNGFGAGYFAALLTD
ncbi:MAG: nickel pincer cofactor biosynthesis protein LarB [Planctomycetes bacterium]|nr:nickel pincer cofactor biosynthesis protein LarB [Planctomycetota bacterium]